MHVINVLDTKNYIQLLKGQKKLFNRYFKENLFSNSYYI